MLEDYEFALCLTHDVDRPYKTFQAPYYAVQERDLSHLKSLVSSERPYWQFEEIMEFEEELGVRSSFYFLNEKQLFRNKGLREWIKPKNWKLYTGRYDITDDEIVDVIQALDRGGWEVGLHGSYESYNDLERLRYEKEVLESVLGNEILGGRQHYLNLEQPTTWEYHREIGLKYDASLGLKNNPGYKHGYTVQRPFDDDFVVFPLTLMEVALSNYSHNSALERCKSLLEEAKNHGGVMTILWHPRFFSDDYRGYRELYRDVIVCAQNMGAWIGPCRNYYNKIELSS